jgi:hypothetical protein
MIPADRYGKNLGPTVKNSTSAVEALRHSSLIVGTMNIVKRIDISRKKRPIFRFAPPTMASSLIR